MASSMAPLQSLGQDDENEVQHGCFGHELSLALALVLYDADSFTDGMTLLFRSRQSKRILGHVASLQSVSVFMMSVSVFIHDAISITS